jgi:cell division protease FtsH
MDNNNRRLAKPWLPKDSDSNQDEKQDNRHSAWPPKGPEKDGQNKNSNRIPKLPTGKIKKPFNYGFLAMIFVGIVIANLFFSNRTTQELEYSEFEALGSYGVIEEVQIASDKIYITLEDDVVLPTDAEFALSEKINTVQSMDKELYTDRVNDPELLANLKVWGVEKYGGVSVENNPYLNFLLTWILPMALFFFMWRFLLGSITKRGGGGVMDFGKSNAKIYAEDQTGLTFKDVAGQQESKDSLLEIVTFLNQPEKYRSIGAKLPKGALLVGPPGTGKTLLAKAVAGEAKVPFFSISGSEFVQMFVGAGAAKVRDLFKQANEKAPCIVFIDEIDAVGKRRDGMMGGNDEREQTLNQLLKEMDGFDSSNGVVILGATNRPEILDPALLRPGRFDRQIVVERPDLPGRIAILELHSKAVKLGTDVNFEAIAKASAGASGAELANIINEAAIRAVRFKRNAVAQEDLEEAIEVVIAGEQKKDRILSPDTKKRVAFHEVGHALAGELLENADPVHKITIVPRTKGALGYTMQLPGEEKFLITKEEMLDRIAVMLSGRVAEEIIFGQKSTGASNDITQATQTARTMITLYGMSDKFGMVGLERVESQYLGSNRVLECSDATAEEVDREIRLMIHEQHDRATALLKENESLLREVSEYLMEHETITGDTFRTLIEKHKNPEELAVEPKEIDDATIETEPTEPTEPTEDDHEKPEELQS